MELFPERRILIRIFGLSITYYAVLIVSGAFFAYYFGRKNAKKAGYDLDKLESWFLSVLIMGICGARLWFCLFSDIGYYLANPLRFLEIYKGGLAIHGGVIVGLIYSYLYCKKNHYSFLKYADQLLPCVLLAQAIGRWGNFINGECHGGEVPESFFDGFFAPFKNYMLIDGKYYEPVFFYESMLCLLGFILINFVLRKTSKRRGDMAYAYLMWYGVVRFFIEMKRTDPLYIGGIKMAELTSLTYILIGLLGFIGVYDRFIKKDKPVIVFDLDGTILDTKKGILSSYEHLFEKYDKVENFTEARKLEVVGPPLRKIFPQYFPGQDVDKLIDEYQKHNKEIFASVNKPMEHAKEVLTELKQEGYHLAIVSSKISDTVRENLRVFEMEDLFEDVVGVEMVKKAKPDPEAFELLYKRNGYNHDAVIYVGDTVDDIEGGKNVDAFTVLYYTEDEPRKDVVDAKANVYIDDLRKIKEIIKEDRYFTYQSK